MNWFIWVFINVWSSRVINIIILLLNICRNSGLLDFHELTFIQPYRDGITTFAYWNGRHLIGVKHVNNVVILCFYFIFFLVLVDTARWTHFSQFSNQNIWHNNDIFSGHISSYFKRIQWSSHNAVPHTFTQRNIRSTIFCRYSKFVSINFELYSK